METIKALLILIILGGSLALIFKQVDDNNYNKEFRNKPRINFNFKQEVEFRALANK